MTKKKIKYLAGHQRSWVWGRHAVLELLNQDRWPIVDLFLGAEMDEKERYQVATRASEHGAKVQVISYAAMKTLCGVSDHQGFLVRMGPFPYVGIESLVIVPDVSPLFIVLEGIRDPYNLGAIIRSSVAFGASAIILGGEGQTPINSQTVRSSAGTVMRIPICLLDGLDPVFTFLSERNIPCLATLPSEGIPVWTYDFRQPVAVLLGNESKGISPCFIERCADMLRIPMRDSMNSLNVAAAASVVLYEAYRQRGDSIHFDKSNNFNAISIY